MNRYPALLTILRRAKKGPFSDRKERGSPTINTEKKGVEQDQNYSLFLHESGLTNGGRFIYQEQEKGVEGKKIGRQAD